MESQLSTQDENINGVFSTFEKAAKLYMLHNKWSILWIVHLKMQFNLIYFWELFLSINPRNIL